MVLTRVGVWSYIDCPAAKFCGEMVLDCLRVSGLFFFKKVLTLADMFCNIGVCAENGAGKAFFDLVNDKNIA